MKTAKEVCEEINEKEVSYVISKIIENDGVFNTRPVHINYGDTTLPVYVITHCLKKSTLDKLKSLGYKVEIIEETLILNYMPKYKHIEKSKGFWFFKKTQTESVQVGYDPVLEKVEWYKISACCGDTNESN